jgi:tetratricopeptide (TPR) repeat protein
MAETPLELSLLWKKKFAEALRLIKAKEFKQAISVLKEALTIVERLEKEDLPTLEGMRDLRTPETMERLAFVYQLCGLDAESEAMYKETLDIIEGRFMAFRTEERCVIGLSKLYDSLGRTADRVALRQKYPRCPDDYDGMFPVLEEDSDVPITPYRGVPETSLMRSLKMVIDKAKDSRIAFEIAEELLVHTEEVFGTNSSETNEVLNELGQAYLFKGNKLKAEELFTRALKIALAQDSENAKEIAECMRNLASCDPHTALSRAFTTKARAIEKELNIQNPLDLALHYILQASGRTPEPEQSPAEVERLLQNWRASQPESEIPFVSMEVSPIQRNKQILSLQMLSLTQVEECEANDEHPLSTICLLGDIAHTHLALEQNELAKKFKKREMDIIKKHWGEGHSMYVEAYEEYESY